MTSEEQVAASDWLKPISLAARPVGSASQLWVVTCHQYEFLRSFLRRNFEGKPMVASCFSGCKTVQGCPYRISSCWVNTTIRRGIKRLGISFGSIFVLFSNKSSRGGTLLIAGENPWPPALNDNPENSLENLLFYLLLKTPGVSLLWRISEKLEYTPLSKMV